MTPDSDGPVSALGVRSGEGRRTHPLSGALTGFLWGAGVGAAFAFSAFLDGDFAAASISLTIGFSLGMLYGFSSWWFTRYIIDETEIRIETGFLMRGSRRIPFARLQSVDINQPFLARFFDLAELTLEMAGGSESKTNLRFLPLAEAVALRELLLERKHGVGQPATAKNVEPTTVITSVPPQHLVLGAILSLDLLNMIGISVVILVVAILAEIPIGALVGSLPFLFATVQMLSSRIVAQWGFTLTRGSHGLRITRGLFSRTSQTIPFDRVQGVRMVEPLIWRKLGWARLEVDVAGYAGSSSEDDETSSMLLPIGPRELAVWLIDELVPEADDSLVLEVKPDVRARVFAPIGWKYRWLRRGDATVSSKTGWISHSTSVVPHHKVQSVAIIEGPLQRLRKLATVQIDTPDGPVDVELRNVDACEATEIAIDETNRARSARAAIRAAAKSAAVAVDLSGGVDTADDLATVEPAVREMDFPR